MKRSRRVVLMMMGAATVSGSTIGSALAQRCYIDERFPPGDPRRTGNCYPQRGFGASSYRVRRHFSAGG